MRDDVTHGTAVGRLRLNINDLHAVLFKEVADGSHREEECMLVIDLVVGGLFDDIPQVGILEHNNPGRFEQNSDPFDNRMQIRDMAHDIRGQKSISLTVFRNYPMCQTNFKKFGNCVDPLVDCHLGHVLRWLNTQMSDADVCKVLQHDPVVASHFYNKRFITDEVISSYVVSKGFKVARHKMGRTGKKGIVFVKHTLPVWLVKQLNHAA